MAQNLPQLKRRIKTANNISQVARSMEMISASKIKRAQAAVENNKPYAQRIVDLTGSILRHVDSEHFKHAYIQGNESNKALILIISSDKGLCGSLNTNLFRKLLETDDKNRKIIALGRKGAQFAVKASGEFITGLNLGTTLPDYSIVFRLIEIINLEYLAGNVGQVQILYNEFSSVFSQTPVLKTILPIQVTSEEKELPYLFEPKIDEIVESLMPYYLEAVIYNSILEAYTSEQAARMVAMQNAKNNAMDIADYLTLSYNKSRQEKITSELLALSSTN